MNGYNKITIEAATTGWIVTEKGLASMIFTRWDILVRYLASRLSTKD